MRILSFVLGLALLLGSSLATEAKIRENSESRQNLAEPKIPRLVDQSPADPKLVARDDYYSPQYLEVEVERGGNTIALKNRGGNIHGFMIPKLQVQTILKPGEAKQVSVPNAKSGVYDFICPFHPQMRGTIEVIAS